jgi:hypothetical protein
VVSVVVPLMLAVLSYARGRGFDSRSRRLNVYMVYIARSFSRWVFCHFSWVLIDVG